MTMTITSRGESHRAIDMPLEEATLSFKPNYRQQRTDRKRAKEAKKEKKQLRQQERVALRKADEKLPKPADEGKS